MVCIKKVEERNVENYEDAIDAMAKKLNNEITSLPLNGIFKVSIKNHVSDEDKAETKRMLEYLAEALGRPDVMIIVEDVGDLN
jgi:hypothetical protein